jgi:hypothetical protein
MMKQPIETAPRDGSWILAQVADMSGSTLLAHLSGRWFVVRYIAPDDWSLFPGCGVSERSLDFWLPMPAETGA